MNWLDKLEYEAKTNCRIFIDIRYQQLLYELKTKEHLWFYRNRGYPLCNNKIHKFKGTYNRLFCEGVQIINKDIIHIETIT